MNIYEKWQKYIQEIKFGGIVIDEMDLIHKETIVPYFNIVLCGGERGGKKYRIKAVINEIEELPESGVKKNPNF